MTAPQAGGFAAVMPSQPDYQLARRYEADPGNVYLTGIHALMRMLLDRQRHEHAAGRRTAMYVSGYEGSPLAGFDLELGRHAQLLAQHDIVHQPGLNEELAVTAISGTQLAEQVGIERHDGITGVWYGKAPGLDRSGDALRHASLVGTSGRGGAVAVVGDDPAAKSSSAPSSSEYGLADLLISTLVPADPAEILTFGMHAVELSRASGLWSALKIDTAVADGSRTLSLPRWSPPDLTGLPDGRVAYQHRPSARLLDDELMRLEESQFLIRVPLAVDYIRRSDLNVLVNDSPAQIGIVAAGKTYLAVLSALRLLGLDPSHPERHQIRLLKLGAVHPLEPEIIGRFAAGLAEIVVVEDKRPFLEDSIKALLYGQPSAPAVWGKHGPDRAPLFSPAGDLQPQAIAAGLAARLATLDGLTGLRDWRPPQASRPRTTLTLAERREPYFCSGCPHNSSTRSSGDSLVGAGIGCHAMVLFMSPEQVGDVTGLCQMGGEGGHWIGMAPFVRQRHFIQNLGDGTFAHSGSLAIRAAVAAGVNVTFRLLRNSAVAMTGGQHAVGELPLPELVALLRSEGVARIAVTSPQPAELRRSLPRHIEVAHRDDLAAVQRRLAEVPGVTVLIHDQECAAEKRRKRRRGTAPVPARRMFINERVCEGCGDCGKKSNCLSVRPVDTDYGRKTRIDQSSCNLDYSCLAGDCPSFLSVTTSGHAEPRGRPASGPQVPLYPDVLPEPDCPGPSAAFGIRITGIGGTGVVTTAQILAVAALIDGKQTRGLDQTGMAQKGGAVVSDLLIMPGDQPGAARLTDGAADLYLGCDVLVAADAANLRAASPGRTFGIISTSEIPTGRMVADPEVTFPAFSRIADLVEAACSRTLFIDAADLAGSQLGSEQYANMVMLGAAFQAGALPISGDALTQAITLNGVEVQANLAAFTLGRAHVACHGPAGVAGPSSASAATASNSLRSAAESLLREGTAATIGLDSALGDLLVRRVSELIAYQNQAYARRYVSVVAEVRAAEARVGSTTGLTTAVAEALFGLMAYKDEYEVARLSLLPELQQQLQAQFGPDAKFAFQLHPPLLRALGLRRKISLGSWFRIVFRALYAARTLRGTALDPFGKTKVRRTERRLITEYTDAVTRVLEILTSENLPEAIKIVQLPEIIRGYETVKLAAIDRYHDQLAVALDRYLAQQHMAGIQR